MTDINKETEESEIDLLELAGKLWSKKKFILKVSLIGFVVGVIIALSIPKEYTTTVVLTSESSKGSAGGMGALASMAGINIGGAVGGNIFAPELYPDVLSSTSFVKGLLEIKVSDKNRNINTTLYNYIKDEQKSPWWSYILKAPGALIGIFSSNDTELNSDSIAKNNRFISNEDMGVIGVIRDSYSISTDKKTGVTTIMVTAQSAEISAYLADTITSYLQTYIIDKRTQKARTDLENSEKLYKDAKNSYEAAQYKLASFTDGNINLTSARALTNKEKLQSEATLTYGVYTQMAQQVQLNKIKVQDDTPVFTIIQPAIEPLFPEKPKKKMIVMALVFLGFAGACGWVLGKDYYKKLKLNNNEK